MSEKAVEYHLGNVSPSSASAPDASSGLEPSTEEFPLGFTSRWERMVGVRRSSSMSVSRPRAA